VKNFREYFSADDIKPGYKVKNCNPKCNHYGSTGIVRCIKKIQDPENADNIVGDEVEYVCDCDGPTWKKGDILNKTKDQLEVEK
jgi:hypothetical protein